MFCENMINAVNSYLKRKNIIDIIKKTIIFERYNYIMKKITNNLRKFLCCSVAMLLLVSAVALPVSAVGANASANSKISEYTCDFEDNYYSSVAGSIEASDNGSALRFKVDSSSATHHFEIYNSANGEFKLTHGNVYAVKVSFKVESVSDYTESEVLTTINLVRYNGSSDTLVKIKAFPNASFAPGDKTGWMTATIVFKASIADSPEYNRLAVNVVSPSCPSSKTSVESDSTYIWFDDITVTECSATTATIDFQSNGGSYCDVMMAQSGETISLPTPTRDLYDFAGWYTDSALTKKFNSNKMPSSLITKLYAAWEVLSTSIKVEFADAYDTAVTMEVGRAGDALSLPTPVRANFNFAGWYLDKEYKTKCTYTAFPDASVVLYAKWEVIPFFCGFENPADYGAPNNGSFTKRCNISEEEPYCGKNLMFYDYAQGMQTDNTVQYRALATVILINEYGEKYRSTPGTEYILTFKYKITEVTQPGSFGIIASAADNAWSERSTQVEAYAEDAVNYDKKDVGKGWQTGTIRFTSHPKFDNPDFGYIGIGIAGDAKLYFDNVVLHEADEKAKYNEKCMISFDSRGGSSCETIYGEYNETVVLPKDPVREGYSFMGWYVDPDCCELFDGEKFENGYRKLYANWHLVPVETPQEEPETETPPAVEVEEEESKNNSMRIYIIIGVATAVVIAGAVVTLVVLKKKKDNK